MKKIIETIFIEELKLNTTPSGIFLGKIKPDIRYKLIQYKVPLHSFHQMDVFELHLAGDFDKSFETYSDPTSTKWQKTGYLVTLDEDENLYFLTHQQEIVHSKEGVLFPLLIENLFNLPDSYYIELNGKFIIFHFDKAIIDLKEFAKEKDIPLDYVYELSGKLSRDEVIREYSEGHLMLDENSPKSKVVKAYVKESLPLMSMFLVSLVLIASVQVILQLYTSHKIDFKAPLLYGSLFSLFLLFLQLKIAEGLRDYEINKRERPTKILSRDLISFKNLETLLYGIIGLNVLLNHFMGKEFLIVMATMQACSFLAKYIVARIFLIMLIIVYSTLNSINIIALF